MKHEIVAMLAGWARRGHRQHRLDQLVPPATAPVGLHRQQARRAGDDPQRRGRLRPREGIRINAICPGAIDTPMLRAAMERRGRQPRGGRGPPEPPRAASAQPDEIAQAGLWLCSDESSFTTGHAVGRRRRLPRPLTARRGPVAGSSRRARSVDAAGSAGQRPVELAQCLDRIGDLDRGPARGPAPVTFGPKSSRKMIRDGTTPRRSAVRS